MNLTREQQLAAAILQRWPGFTTTPSRDRTALFQQMVEFVEANQPPPPIQPGRKYETASGHVIAIALDITRDSGYWICRDYFGDKYFDDKQLLTYHESELELIDDE